MVSVRLMMQPTADVIAVADTVQDAAKKLAHSHGRALAVQDSRGRFVGIIIERDIVKACVATGANPATMPVADLPRHRVHTLDDSTDAVTALKTLRDHHAHELPVINRDTLVGVVVDTDIVAHLLNSNPTDVLV